MHVSYNGGFVVRDGLRILHLDSRRSRTDAVVTHGHMDHLSSGGHMTPETLDILKVRKRKGTGQPLEMDREREVGGFAVTLRPAGHTFGSAMVRVDDLLYTGDFNPEGGETAGRAEPEPCSTLIVDGTFGHPTFRFPDKREVEEDFLAWAETRIAEGPFAVGAYEFGKAQELVALLNRRDIPVALPDKTADLADVFRRHGVGLSYGRMSELSASERRDPRAYVVTRRWLNEPPKKAAYLEGMPRAFVSGWCAANDFTRGYGLDAQFPLSDHADYDALVEFVAACRPRRVYTAFSYARQLARHLGRALRIPVEPLLPKKRGG